MKKTVVGIGSDKPDAIKIMTEAAASEPEITVTGLEAKYPQGADKILIKTAVNRKVPKGGVPADVGVHVQNVGTAIAVYEAVRYGRPFVERVLTVTGEAINYPANLIVKVGTLITDIIEECGGFSTDVAKIIAGGPMTGTALSSPDVPVTKSTSAVLVLPAEGLASAEEFRNCIRCGRCIEVCPMGLMPSMLGVTAEKGFYEMSRQYNLQDCFECGSCTYVCPSNRPIVQFVKLAKSLAEP